ncbi:hypothetical protein [Lysobacter gummosus]|uniref:hypothetical protein n=1 Tax=Lysobacter gummosus TaxID=262324 RepID=UPI00363A4BBD
MAEGWREVFGIASTSFRSVTQPVIPAKAGTQRLSCKLAASLQVRHSREGGNPASFVQVSRVPSSPSFPRRRESSVFRAS